MTKTLYGLLVGGLLTMANSAEANVYHVRPDGHGDFPTIQVALDAADDGDVLELTAGTFRGDGNRDIDYLGKGIILRPHDGVPGSCVIDCEADTSTAHRGFYFHHGEDSTSVLEGVEIRNGNFVAQYPNIGGAVFCTGSSCPRITNVIFRNNEAIGGGGLYCEPTSSPVLRGCVFIGNHARQMGGGIHWAGATASLTECTFHDNSADEYGGGLMCYQTAADSRIIRCTFAGNHATHGGGGIGIIYYAHLSLLNCTFYANSSGFMCAVRTQPELENTTIAFSDSGPAIDFLGDSLGVSLSCCNLYGNSGGDWTEEIVDQYGNGNISKDPLFCEPAEYNLLLRADSPCSGDSSACGLIGAFPIGCPASSVAELGLPSPPGARIEPNPCSGACRLSLQIPDGGAVTAVVYDVRGHRVRSLYRGEPPRGSLSLSWNGRDEGGREVPSGVYLVRASTPMQTIVGRVQVLR